MKLDVAFLPRLLSDPEASVCVVIDALRASSSIVTLLAGGAQEIVVAESPAAARRIARQEPRRYVLAGEENGLAPRGFDYGNSPSEFASMDLKGQRIILSTTNGTRALRQVATSPLVLVGGLVNASAVMRTLLAEAEARRLNAALVCAGLSRGKRLSLEDAIAAGALVDTALKTAPGKASLDLTDGALIAHRLYRAYRGDALAAFRQSEHGRSLIALGFAHDLAFCAQADRFAAVPRLRREPSGRLTLFVEKM
jgi:2-phosphosulfolactate phosphatase